MSNPTPVGIVEKPQIPIVCDMNGAPDTPVERIATYRSLFADSLVGRERTMTGIRFRFADHPGIEDRVRTVARLESLCCAFFTFNVAVAGGEVLLDVSTIDDERARSVLDEFFRLPESVDQPIATLQQSFENSGLTFAVDPSMRQHAGPDTSRQGSNKLLGGAAAVACVGACSFPLVGAAFAAGIGSRFLGLPMWAYGVGVAAVAGGMLWRRRLRSHASGSVAAGSCSGSSCGC